MSCDLKTCDQTSVEGHLSEDAVNNFILKEGKCSISLLQWNTDNFGHIGTKILKLEVELKFQSNDKVTGDILSRI